MFAGVGMPVYKLIQPLVNKCSECVPSPSSNGDLAVNKTPILVLMKLTLNWEECVEEIVLGAVKCAQEDG